MKDPVVITYSGVLVELAGSLATFEAGAVAVLSMDREHWVSLGRPGAVEIRVVAAEVAS